MDTEYTLLSWIARNHDPEHTPKDAAEDAPAVPGPTLTLLTHERSPYRGKVRRVVIVSQQDEVSRGAVARTQTALRKAGVNATTQAKFVALSGPTDHLSIRDAVLPIYKQLLSEQQHNQKLLVNVSPGTPAMHAVWLLLTQTDPDFAKNGELVETREEKHTGGGPMARPVDLDLRTEFKLHATRVLESASPETAPIVDPSELQSPRLRDFYEEAARIARLRVPVLIRGERGTGKTTVASFIRSKTPRSGSSPPDTAWQVACGSFTEQLLAAELFGHVKGAFTGAVKDTPGLLATIGEGALFLDEVGDLSKPMQRTLIKVVEEGEYRQVGARVAMRTNARFVFATNVDDDALTERIDADFLDRVGYIRLHVPPLRECRDDLPMLWRRVATAAGRRADFDLDERLDDAAHRHVVERLQADPLSGNFRDLYRVAYRLCVELQRGDSSRDAIDAAFRAPPLLGNASRDADPFAAAVSAWLDDEPLTDILSANGSIPIKEGTEGLKVWLAAQLKAAATALGLKHDDVSDLPERTLRSWASGKDK